MYYTLIIVIPFYLFFNFGCINWETKSTIMRSVSADLFLDIICNLFLELVNEPTRIRNEHASSLLDLVLTNNIYFVDDISVHDQDLLDFDKTWRQ